jgi:hypothetical protein
MRRCRKRTPSLVGAARKSALAGAGWCWLVLAGVLAGALPGALPGAPAGCAGRKALQHSMFNR